MNLRIKSRPVSKTIKMSEWFEEMIVKLNREEVRKVKKSH